MGKFLALPGINAKVTRENNSDRKQIFLLAMSAAAVVHTQRNGRFAVPYQVFQK